ncbi:MAG: hypothetical protein O2962_07325, partial [Cyanobacteria bacterium]|nr:hypothetical protein [Cyanobacteriota bacterium]
KQLSLEDKLSRENQLHKQLEPLKQQLEMVRKTGPVNGISVENIAALIETHREHLGDLRYFIDAEITLASVDEIPNLKSKVDDYLARYGKLQTNSETVSHTRFDSMSSREAVQIRLIQDAVTKPIFGNGKKVLDSWDKGGKGESYIQRTEDMKQGLFNLMSIREQNLA